MRGGRGAGAAEQAGAQRDASRGAASGAAALTLGLALCALVGCGAGTRQDAHEPKRSFTMQVLAASFPARQAVARPVRMTLTVRNTSGRTVPNVAVTVDSFNYAATTPELAANKRPVWVIEQGPGPRARPPVQSQEVSQPGGAQSVYVNTWALGSLAPGRTQTFSWLVVPVKPGTHTVRYAVAAGLAGNATAALSSGGAVAGRFTVHVGPAPAVTHVDPRTGRLAAGAYPATP